VGIVHDLERQSVIPKFAATGLIPEARVDLEEHGLRKLFVGLPLKRTLGSY
jgi:hypothetical protein